MIAFRLPAPCPLTLEILDGDIAFQSTAAIVNAANNEFWMGAGVAGAIKAAGGAQIEADAMSQGPVEPGECVVTAAGRLPARFVIHAAVMGQNLKTSAALIERATRNALRIAEELQLASVACPALGTGVGGFPVSECAVSYGSSCLDSPHTARSSTSPGRCSGRRSTARRIVRFLADAWQT